MTFNDLKIEYAKDIELSEEMMDTQVLQLPKIMAKYQFFYNDLLHKIADKYELKDKTLHDCVMSYKQGLGEFANFTLNSTELKSIIGSSLVMRECNKELANMEADLKTVEDMLGTIRGMGFNVKNYLDYKKILSGVV